MNTLNTALAWHDLGIATIPILARDKRPALGAWKRYQSEMPRKRDLEMWFGSGRYNLAVITGWRGLVVIDFDDLWTYSRWVAAAGAKIVNTFRVQTRRGWHLYVYCKEATSSMPGDNWDIKAAGGYVLAPPSIHPTGHEYVGVGRPEQIVTIDSVWEYFKRPAIVGPPAPMSASDPFDAAMRDSGMAGVSIEDIKARHTCLSILGLPANGRGVTLLRCPLMGHEDKRESFAVYPNDTFYCFGCGAHGDCLDLYAMIHNVSIADAMRTLA